MTAAVRPILRSAPPYQPPFDDELPAAHLRIVISEGERQLPFEAGLRRHQEGRPELSFDRQRTGRGELPDPAPWARQFIQAALETLSGRRPAAQLRGWTSNSVFAGLQQAGATAATRSAEATLIRSLHVSEPADGIAEVCATVTRPSPHGPRFRAVAARLEGIDGRWRCVTLQIG